MFSRISQEIKKLLGTFSEEDKILFNNKCIYIDKNLFRNILPSEENKSIAFVDGGQAEIISVGNFCMSFIRIFAQVFKNNKKIDSYKNEFYLFTYSKFEKNELYYHSKIFPLKEKLISEEDLLVSSNDPTIKNGLERAPISKIVNIARRFAELELTKNIKADHIILDGTLTPTFKNEEKILGTLPDNVSALTKTSSLFTIKGNSPSILLSKLTDLNCWSYLLDRRTYFVKLNDRSKHVFRFEGNPEALSLMIKNSTDPIFLGYPYGLIFVDRMARVTNEEKSSLKSSFLLKAENKEIIKYLNSNNAHEILDSIY